MEFNNFYYLGHIAKVRGIKGEVSISLDVDYPEDYRDLESVFVATSSDTEPIPFFLEYIHLKDKGFASVKFEDVDTEEKARTLLQKQLFLPLDQLPQLSGKQFYYHEVVGFTVVDSTLGEIGTINQVLDNTANPLLEVKKGFNEILIPINDDVIEHIDRENQRLHVDTPEGLIDLYLGND